MDREADQYSHKLSANAVRTCSGQVSDYAFSECGRREETKIPVTVRMLGHDVASVYVPEEIDDEDHLEEVKREEECDVEPCDGGDELPL